MALQDVTLPKRYKNGRVLFEQTLDAWRLAAQTGFATVNLNLTQLARDCFSTGYNFDNDGAANLTTPLQDQINNLATGATPITGTTSDSFSINTDGTTAVLTTTALTALRTFTFPDITGTFVVTEGTQTVNGAKTFTTRLDATLTTTQLRLAYTSGAVYSDFLVNSLGCLGITPTGKHVGIGTTSPADSASFGVALDIQSNGGAATYYRASGTSPSTQYFVIGYSPTAAYLFQSNNAPMYFYTNSLERMRISADGNIGIGTTSPDAKLDVLSTTEQIRQTYTDGSVYASHLVNSSGYYSNTATGNRYGFGVSPLATLHVKGASGAATIARISGDTGFNGTLQLTDGAHGYALIYDYTNNDFVINYDSTIGTGTQECARWNEAGEMLLPAVDPPTANYGNRNSMVKAWLRYTDGSGSVTTSYNIASVTSDDGDGEYFVNVDTNFNASLKYTGFGTVNPSGASGDDKIISVTGFGVGTISVYIYDVSGTALADQNFSVIFIGDQ